MRLIVFPGGEDAPLEEGWVAELDAALSGDARGPAADAWRELREDVRSLAPPPSDELMLRLERELADLVGPLEGAAADASPGTLGDRSAPRTRRRASLRGSGRPLQAAAAAMAAAVVVAAVVVGFDYHGSSGKGEAVPAPRVAGPVGVTNAGRSGGEAAKAPAAKADLEPVPSAASQPATSAASQPAGAAPGRVQQLGASVGLEAKPADVQAVSDGVARLAVREEGFVEDSHVQVQQHGASEATLTLRLPSARLSAALAAIGRLAPVSSESQSLQDITSEYDATRQRVADATAEHAALERALAKATTEGEIDSLRERLAQSRSAITQARAALAAVSQRASTAEVEVTVLGDASSSGEGLTFHRGLHDAGRVLTVAAIVLLIAAAVLLPLALVLAALVGGGRAWRRYSRERVLRP
jgi:uncharacterized protein DUF4349